MFFINYNSIPYLRALCKVLQLSFYYQKLVPYLIVSHTGVQSLQKLSTVHFLKYCVRYLLEDGSAEVCSIGDAGVDDEIGRGIAQTKVVLQQENDVLIN